MATPKNLDIWLLSSNTVYKGVPFTVAAGWAGQGRMSGSDKIKPAGSGDDWQHVRNVDYLADFLARDFQSKTAEEQAFENEKNNNDYDVEPIEGKKHEEEEDDDVDMIPLIDISLVLLIFFMMTSIVSQFSPVQVPAMQQGAEINVEAGGITIMIDRDADNNPLYAIQVGNGKPKSDDSGRGDQEKLLALLDLELNDVSRKEPAEVRIACHEQLPRKHVGELCVELQKRVEKKQISKYAAEVSELKK